MPREKAYACPVCGWQGMEEPSYPSNDAMCPNCGTLMYPQSWMQTWGLFGLIVLIVLGGIGLVTLFL